MELIKRLIVKINNGIELLRKNCDFYSTYYTIAVPEKSKMLKLQNAIFPPICDILKVTYVNNTRTDRKITKIKKNKNVS